MSNTINYLILRQIRHKEENNWFVEMRIHGEQVSSTWEIGKYVVNRLIKMVKGMPLHKAGLPKFINFQNIFETIADKELVMQCFKKLIILYNKNIIEIKEDRDSVIENEILKSAPDNIYKKIYPYI